MGGVPRFAVAKLARKARAEPVASLKFMVVCFQRFGMRFELVSIFEKRSFYLFFLIDYMNNFVNISQWAKVRHIDR